jgi:peptidoglycan/LPS O-acetylase OafA/YrhL
MDHGARLVWLLLAGALPLLALRERMGETPRGRRLFAALVLLYAAVAVAALAAMLTGGSPRPALPADLPLVET